MLDSSPLGCGLSDVRDRVGYPGGADRRRAGSPVVEVVVMPRTHLITGGAGFIGSHLAEALLDRGDRVVVLDDLSTGRAPNLRAIAGHPHFELVVGSVLDELIVDELVHRCEVVV